MIIDGAAVGEQIRTEVKTGVSTFVARYGFAPGLATVLVGDDPASQTYVRAKLKACAEVGIASIHTELPARTTQDEVVAIVRALARRTDVHGILVQVPLPDHMREEDVLNEVPLGKDVDGFSASVLGRLGVKGKYVVCAPCTPQGCIELLERNQVQIAGAHAVVLGRSTIVGLPVAMMLLARDATVTICHSRTQELANHVRRADIVIAAIGRPKFVTADMIKPGAVVIDVGVNRVPDASRKSGFRLVGDVDFDAVKSIAGAITPVPGGVGPLTIAMLMKNTLRAAQALCLLS